MKAIPAASLAIAPLMLFAASASGPAIAGPNGVPFKATLVTQEVLRPDPLKCQSFPFLAGTTVGSGHASHLGAVTGTGSDCITPVSTTQYTFTNGKLVLIAANGDELHATYGGNLTPSATPSIYVINGTYVITGGTGRSSGASGGGPLTGLENLSTGQGQLDFSGSISY